MYRKILAAIDGSEPSLQALKHAVQLASNFDSQLVIISVMHQLKLPFQAHLGIWSTEYHNKIKQGIEEMLHEAKNWVLRHNPQLYVETVMMEGRPWEIIVNYAANENVDLIVMGREGEGGVEGWVLGSTSKQVADNSTKPILIVK